MHLIEEAKRLVVDEGNILQMGAIRLEEDEKTDDWRRRRPTANGGHSIGSREVEKKLAIEEENIMQMEAVRFSEKKRFIEETRYWQLKKEIDWRWRQFYWQKRKDW